MNDTPKFEKTIGTKEEVFKGIAKKTSGGLQKEHLIESKRGKIISLKRHENGKKAFKNILEKHNANKNADDLKENEAIIESKLPSEEEAHIEEPIAEPIEEKKIEESPVLNNNNAKSLRKSNKKSNRNI